MIQSNKPNKPRQSDLIAFTIFIQNICLGQSRCTPKCPLKDPYYRCKIIVKPTWLSSLNSFMYNKIAIVHPLFRNLRNKCIMTSCKDCELIVCDEDNRYSECSYFAFISKLRNCINKYVGCNWRYKRW